MLAAQAGEDWSSYLLHPLKKKQKQKQNSQPTELNLFKKLKMFEEKRKKKSP